MILHTHEYATSKIQQIDINELLYSKIRNVFYTTEMNENILPGSIACSILSVDFFKQKMRTKKISEINKMLI
jgi:hypothetical protein